MNHPAMNHVIRTNSQPTVQSDKELTEPDEPKVNFVAGFGNSFCLVQDMSTRFCSKVPIGIAFSELCAQLSDCRQTELLDVCLETTSLLSFSLQILRLGELRL